MDTERCVERERKILALRLGGVVLPRQGKRKFQKVGLGLSRAAKRRRGQVLPFRHHPAKESGAACSPHIHRQTRAD